MTDAGGEHGTCRVEHVMGTTFVVDVRELVAPEVVDEVFDWFRFVDEAFSTFKEGSEISRIDRGELAREDAHDDVRTVLTRCDMLRAETGGYFDAYATGRLDPSGLVKGWSADRAGALLEDAGARNFAIYAGGDVLVRGQPADDARWLIGIRHPTQEDELAAVVAGDDLAVATSAAYARGRHISSPRTGRPAEGLHSVTITGPDLATADAFATAAFAMGGRALGWAASLDGYEAMAIVDDTTAFLTPGFPAVGL